jgi:TolA-binding protein
VLSNASLRLRKLLQTPFEKSLFLTHFLLEYSRREMSGKIKLWSYVVLSILAIWFGLEFRSNYAAVSKAGSQATNSTVATPPATATKAAPTAGQTNSNVAGAATNSPAGTNDAAVTGTNDVAQTNDVSQTNALAGSNALASGSVSNVAGQSNAPAAAPAALATNASPVAPTASATPSTSGSTVAYLGLFVLTVILLGCLVAYDVTQIVGSRAVDFLFDERSDGIREPEYEHAEQIWANGQFLEAIQLMRDYLKKNPREQYVALRIAEVYEKDLKNYLAAALEYEEILKKKLPAERWGWAAIHLCNLYTRMNQPVKAKELLERIANEYPKTGAAKKARARLGLAEIQEEEEKAPEPEAEPEEDESVHQTQKTFEVTNPDDAPFDFEEPEEPPPPPPPPEPKSSLPPGFRPKK